VGTVRENIEEQLAEEFGVSQLTIKRVLMSHSRFYADAVINDDTDVTVRIRNVGKFEHISKSIQHNRDKMKARKLRKQQQKIEDEPFEFE